MALTKYNTNEDLLNLVRTFPGMPYHVQRWNDILSATVYSKGDWETWLKADRKFRKDIGKLIKERFPEIKQVGVAYEDCLHRLEHLDRAERPVERHPAPTQDFRPTGQVISPTEQVDVVTDGGYFNEQGNFVTRFRVFPPTAPNDRLLDRGLGGTMFVSDYGE